jgi:signal transduction histidine kinase/CHASE2 domain-containing sensor protein
MRSPSTNPISISKRVLLVGSTLTLISCLLWWTPPIQELNRRVSDSWLRLRTELTPSPQVTLVLIDDHSLQQFGRWPWPRTLLADLVKKTSASNPKVIGLDILLPETESGESDDALADAIRRAGNVVLVSKISGSSEGGLWIEPLPKFAEAAQSVGHAQAVLDSDGICRRFPLAEMSLDGPYNAFALEVTALSDRDAEAAFVRFHEARTGHSLLERRAGVETVSPIVAPISFRTRTRHITRFTTVSAADVLNGSTFASLKGKSVLIGFGSSDIHDRLVIPVSEDMPTPGVEIHAHIVDAILAHRFLAPISLMVQFVVLAFVCFLSAFINLRQRTWTALLGSILFSVLIYIAGYVAYIRFDRSSDAGLMMCSALLALPLVQLEKLLRVERSVTQQLQDLRSTLNTPESSQAIATEPSVNWKLDTLAALQSKLASMYEFEHALLENTHDRIAVFSEDGEMLFCNTAFRQLWDSECNSAITLQEFIAWLTNSGITLELEKLPMASESLLGGRLWNLRLTKIPTGEATPAQLMVVMTDLQARLERDQTRTEALAFVTHELRTPLVAIQGFAELMMRFPQQRDSREAPEIIFRESRRLVALINSYLDVLRLDSGARPIRIEPVNINLIAQHMARVLQPLADINHNRVTVSPCREDPTAYCDGALISGALMNLVSNAIKYGGDASEVRVSIRIRECDLVLSVWNSGPPIPEQELEHLFDPYFRGSAGHEQRPGWGLGLAFVKRVVDQHHGKLTATSTEQSGTEFQIVLPGAIRLVQKEVGAS